MIIRRRVDARPAAAHDASGAAAGVDANGTMSAILHHIRSLESYAARSGARLIRGDLPESVDGRLGEGLITLRARLSPEQELIALVHELAHWLAHRGECENAPSPARTVFEYEAEAVEALVMARLGFAHAEADAAPGDTPGEESLPTDGLLSSSVARVISTSRRICQALGLDPD
jgi:IrrE N-terminal-like domain